MMSDVTIRAFWRNEWARFAQPVTNAIFQRIGGVLAWLGLMAGLHPTFLTFLSASAWLVAGVVLSLAPAGPSSAILFFGLLTFAYALDCADGQLARASGRTSAFGAWADVAADQLANVVLGIGIALSIANSGEFALGYSAGAAFAVGRSLSHLRVAKQPTPFERARKVSPGRFLARCMMDAGLMVLLLPTAWLVGPTALALVGFSYGLVYFVYALLGARPDGQ